MAKFDNELAEFLWTARWAISNKKMELAYEEVTRALIHIGAEKTETHAPPPGDDMTPPIKLPEIKQPEFITVKGCKFNNRGHYETPSGMFEGLTIHYTVSNRTAASAQAVVRWLASQGYMCMVMDEDGKIYTPEGFDVLRHWGYHSGVSKWQGVSSVSNRFAGMEICCWGRNPDSSIKDVRTVTTAQGYIVAGKYQMYTEKQVASLTNFILWALTVNKQFKIEKIAGHDELRKEAGKLGDKQDPGGSLPMPMAEYRKFLTKEASKLGIK